LLIRFKSALFSGWTARKASHSFSTSTKSNEAEALLMFFMLTFGENKSGFDWLIITEIGDRK
jgi:hypothetical protein